MTYVIDGVPISDQLTGAFGNSVDSSVVQSIELFTGNIPAEFGNKVSGVAVVTTRTGLGTVKNFLEVPRSSPAGLTRSAASPNFRRQREVGILRVRSML